MKIYLCDFKKCAVCQKFHPEIDCGCRHTTDPDHALHKGKQMQFEKVDNDEWEVGDDR